MKKVVITYGLIAGAVVSALMAVSMISQKDHLENMGAGAMIIGYLGMLIAFTFIFVAVKNYRDKENGGIVSFGKAFSIGLLISLIASATYVITWHFVYTYHMPNFMEGYSARMIAEAKGTLSGAELDAEMAKINSAKDMYATPIGFILFTLAEILPVGILVSLIVALVLKRKRPAVQA